MANNPLESFLRENSTRHHYIPRFLINGFTENGKLFVYDKGKDQILSKQLSPKSIFFENYRNTIDLSPNVRTSIIEDKLYSKVDNDCAEIINKYQSEDLDKIVFTHEEIATVLFFQISLFWRILRTDDTVEDILERSSIISDTPKNKHLNFESSRKKLDRINLVPHTIEELKKSDIKQRKIVNIHELSNSTFVIGDYPFVFRKQMTSFREFDDYDSIMALSSKRIYSTSKKSIKSFSEMNAYCYNALVILHSVRYIAGCNIEILKKSIKLFKNLSNKNIEEIYKKAFCENDMSFRQSE